MSNKRRRVPGRPGPGSAGKGGLPVLVRHALAAAATALLVGLFWASRQQWPPDVRLWRALGDASLILLLLTLTLGPVARLWPAASKVLPWRRELGIWFALAALLHSVIVFAIWTQWSPTRLLGYEFLPQLGRVARMEPGFGLANLMGLVALVWALILAATSSDRALRRVGAPAWKWLHMSAHVIFYLVVLHAAYFLYMHYSVSFHQPSTPPDWFRAPFLVLAALIISLQAAAFLKTVQRRQQHAA